MTAEFTNNTMNGTYKGMTFTIKYNGSYYESIIDNGGTLQGVEALELINLTLDHITKLQNREITINLDHHYQPTTVTYKNEKFNVSYVSARWFCKLCDDRMVSDSHFSRLMGEIAAHVDGRCYE